MLSLMCLKWSRSRYRMASMLSLRRAAASASDSRSSSSTRFGKSVRKSCSARWRVCSSFFLRSLMSLRMAR
ncbi:hypothetical protein D3C81_1455540 [compost metagenome]